MVKAKAERKHENVKEALATIEHIDSLKADIAEAIKLVSAVSSKKVGKKGKQAA